MKKNYPRLFVLGNFRLVSLTFNWSPLENSLNIKVHLKVLPPEKLKLVSPGVVFFIRVRVLKSKIAAVLIQVLNLILGESFEIQCLAIFYIDF